MGVAMLIAAIAGIALSSVQSALSGVSTSNRKKIEKKILDAKKIYGNKSKELQTAVDSAVGLLGLAGDRGSVARDIKRQRELNAEIEQKRAETENLADAIDYARGLQSNEYVWKGDVADVESKLGGNI